MILVEEVRADHDVAVDSSERVDLEDRVETRGVPSDRGDLADQTGPVDCRDPSADLVEGLSTDSVPDCVIFAARGSLIGGLGSVDLDRSPVCVVAEAVDVIFNGRRSDPEAN